MASPKLRQNGQKLSQISNAELKEQLDKPLDKKYKHRIRMELERRARRHQ